MYVAESLVAELDVGGCFSFRTGCGYPVGDPEGRLPDLTSLSNDGPSPKNSIVRMHDGTRYIEILDGT